MTKKVIYRTYRPMTDEERKEKSLPTEMELIESGVTPWETIMDDLLVKEDIEIEAEFGSSENIRWGCGVLMNSDQEPCLCKCGNPAEQVIIGREAFLGTCHVCENEKLYVKFSNKVCCGKNFGEENE